MARIRTVKPELWASERFSECSPSARLMFIASLNFADDGGNLDRSSRQLKAQALPHDSIDGEPLVEELLRAGLFIEYKVLDKMYLHIKNFNIHQKIDKPSKSRLPAYDSSLSTPRAIAESSPTTRQKNLAEGIKEGIKDQGIPLPPFDSTTIPNLDQSAWADWLRYRAARRPAIKPISLQAAAQAMAKLANQRAAVDYSIANSYQGLIEPPPTHQAKSNGHDSPARQAWQALIGSRGVTRTTRVEAAMKAIGGWAAIEARTDFNSERIQREFCRAWEAA